MKIGITPSSFAENNNNPIKKLRSAGFQIVENPYKRRLTENEAFDFIKDLDGLIAGLEPLTRKVLENGMSLKAIARVGIGTDNIDFDAAKERGIVVSNTPDGPSNSVAEMTVAVLLSLMKNIIPMNNNIHNGVWKKQIGFDLKGKNILFIGFGRIGKKTAELLDPFKPIVSVYDPFLTKEDCKGYTIYSNLEDALKTADIISFHASGVEPIITNTNLYCIKKGAILLNSARGELIPENVIKKGLDEEIISAAWFDSFWQEPYKGVLCNYDNVILTPHASTYTQECRLTMEMNAVENIIRDLGVE